MAGDDWRRREMKAAVQLGWGPGSLALAEDRVHAGG